MVAGETILVTDRDRVVAELRPPGEYPPLAEALLADLQRQGVLTMPTVVREGPPPRLPVASRDDVLRDLDRSRVDR